MQQPESERTTALFAHIPERNTADVILRTAQQHHVALSTMADTKANIIITVSSIVLTLTLGRVDQTELRNSVLILTVFTLWLRWRYPRGASTAPCASRPNARASTILRSFADCRADILPSHAKSARQFVYEAMAGDITVSAPTWRITNTAICAAAVSVS